MALPACPTNPREIRVGPVIRSGFQRAESMHNGSFENLKKILAGIPTAPARGRDARPATCCIEEPIDPHGGEGTTLRAARRLLARRPRGLFIFRQDRGSLIGSWGRAENINR